MCWVYNPSMSKTREILLGRKRQILAEMAPLRAELEEIDIALAAISGSLSPTVTQDKNKPKAQSIGGQALAVLKDYPNGLPTGQIGHQLKVRFERNISNRNMSWHLSHLKKAGHVVLDGELWRIPPAERETSGSEEPDASDSPDDEDGSSSSSSSERNATSLAAAPGCRPGSIGE